MSASTVIPAHLSYLAIYNPTLGSTDETVSDQLVFYHTHKHRADQDDYADGRDNNQGMKTLADGSGQQKDVDDGTNADHIDENERLRQVGLAQGMVDFVNNFSHGVPLESIETKRSRVVIKELESNWWILASIDLTQLPNTFKPSSNNSTLGRKTASGGDTPADNVEYSSREVSSAQLLTSQLVRAHRLFLLHHAPSLSEMWRKLENQKGMFRSLLGRYWTRFACTWDVLLHGNPTADLYDAVKLAGGGELGVGVGEEGWGSGEREVLEGYAGRTDGLVDLLIGRYGEPPNEAEVKATKSNTSPWLSNGEDPRAQDGLIFSGVGGISKPSLKVVSQWMESIYTYGEAAYGVGDNPSARPRRHRKRRKVDLESTSSPSTVHMQPNNRPAHNKSQSSASKEQNLHRTAMANNATAPGIPAPLVSAVEQSLSNAVARVDAQPTDTDDKGGRQLETRDDGKASLNNSMFDTNKMMKYLSLGYGSSWTLNPQGFTNDSSTSTTKERVQEADKDTTPRSEVLPDAKPLQELDPTPDISDDEATPFVQRLEESIGKFLIGLSGDLENNEFEGESNDEEDIDTNLQPRAVTHAAPKRIFLRTLTVEMSSTRFSQWAATSHASPQAGRGTNETDFARGKTSAAASVDGSRPVTTHERVQVAVYVHQPFVFVFLFQLHTSNLSVPSFYRTIHHTLGPLQKSLLRSTDPERWKERMRETLGEDVSTPVEQETRSTAVPAIEDATEIYDLIYDPSKSTIRLSIPNIPLPGSLAAEGLHRYGQSLRPITVSGSWYTLGIPVGSTSSPADDRPQSSTTSLVKSDWTRIEALNVHTHILNTWAVTRGKLGSFAEARPNSEEVERTIKTSRNWWIVWTGLRNSDRGGDTEIGSSPKEAILVRRAPQDSSTSKRDANSSRLHARSISSNGKWFLREQPRSREVSSGSTAISTGATTSAKGVSEGMGIDARKWIAASLRLSM